MKVLLDENLSPRLVSRFAVKGILASHIAHIGRAGMSDVALWRYAYETDQVVVTLNVRDFLILARSTELHAGLIVLRVGNLSPDEQWRYLEPAIDLALAEIVAGRPLINRLIEILSLANIPISDLPVKST